MQQALHGDDLVDLAEFLRREGVDRTKWKITPCCPECGEHVHPYMASAVMLDNFRDNAKSFAKRGARGPGFDHVDNPLGACSNSLRSNPRFKSLKGIEVDARTRARNKEILKQPEVRAMNRKVLEKLLHRLTGNRVINEEDRRRIWDVGKKWLLGMSAMGEHPWLLPYALALLQYKAPFKKGQGELAFQGFGKQSLSYKKYDGTPGALEIPQVIKLCWVDQRGKKTVYSPFKSGGKTEVVFELSEDAAKRLAVGTPDRAPTQWRYGND